VIRGLAVHGQSASLFTLGANNTVQQFDLNTPSMMVANVQHPANLLPPSPPISLEEADKGTTASASESESISIQITADVSESDEDHMSPIARLVRGAAADASDINERSLTASPASSRSHSSVSRSSASSRTPGRHASSVLSRGLSENTYISAGSSSVLSPSNFARDTPRERDSFSTSSLSSVSMGSSHTRSRRRPSALRHEVPRSPEDSKVQDLFKFTRSRLSDVPYKRSQFVDSSRLTNDDLRAQMLSTIFGWNKDIKDLIRDEMSRHPAGAPSRILLSKWLGDIETDIMKTSSENMTSSDWMMLALSGIGQQSSQQKLGGVYVQKLLESGDLHAAATIMIGMGEHNDAIEVYVSHKKYMEALILTCLLFPSVWERQKQIVKKWGEWAVQHGHKQLSIRCFACTEQESTEPWTSPSAAQVAFQNITPSIPEVLSPPLSPPSFNRGPQRSIAKNSSLKLITSFGDHAGKAKFYSGADDGKTPIAGGVTPIAESAISPGGHQQGFAEPTTAFIRPSRGSTFNTPSSARSNQSQAFARQRLPSIGEATIDSPRQLLKTVAAARGGSRTGSVASSAASSVISDVPATPPIDAAMLAAARVHSPPPASSNNNLAIGLAQARAATASPLMMRDVQTHSRKDAPPPSPSPQSLAALMEGPARRNGSRTRIPNGVDLHLAAQVETADPSDMTSPEQSIASSTRFHWPSRRRGPGSVASSTTSAASSIAARSQRSHRDRGEHGHAHASQSHQRPPASKTLEDYIHSLDTAQHHKQRQRSREKHRGRDHSAGRKSRDASADRGRASSRAYSTKSAKRSPTSPVPMSPEDLINLSTPRLLEGRMAAEGVPQMELDGGREPSTVRKMRTRESSRTRIKTEAGMGSRASSRGPGRRPPDLDLRGRSKERTGSVMRSPSSPLPMSAGAKFTADMMDDEEQDLRLALEAKEKFRNRNNRSTSRSVRGDPTSPKAARERSESRRRTGASISRGPTPAQPDSRKASPPTALDLSGLSLSRRATPAQQAPTPPGGVRQIKEERQAKKEAAARELEERRKSLARRALATPIPHPAELSPPVGPSPMVPFELPSTTFVPHTQLPTRSQTTAPGPPPRSMYANRSGASIGLPATPKAMRLIIESDPRAAADPVPAIPATFAQASPPQSTTASPQKDGGPSGAGGDLLTLLPSTVYSPPTRPPMIARSMSCPPEEPVAPAILSGTVFQAPGPSSNRGVSRRQSLRKLSTGGDPSMRQPTDRRPSADEGRQLSRRPSYDNQIPIPPPPPPPPAAPVVMLKELQHLAAPPPPPPAPLPYAANGQLQPVVYGGGGSHGQGTIEIVMDEPDRSSAIPVAATRDSYAVPILSAPLPPERRSTIGQQQQPQSHHRGRASVDNSIAGRISRATERIRSASRGRQSASHLINRTKSPEDVPGMPSMGGQVAPYESIPPPVSFTGRAEIASPIEESGQDKRWRTGLLESEMI
jgi:hypothetical protein